MEKVRNFWGAHLFVPANNAGFIDKLPYISTNNAILDLEWATNYNKKDEARIFVKHALKYLKKANKNLKVTVRVNCPYTGSLFIRDLLEIISAEPDVIRIPTVICKEDICKVEDIFLRLENMRQNKIDTKIHVMIENAKGFENIFEIAGASKRIEALCLGGEDWVTNIGMERKKTSYELKFIRNYIAIVAAKYNLIAIDSVYPWLDDLNGLAEDTEYSRNIGYVARALQNPKQISTVNKIYTPSLEKLNWAKQLLGSVEKINNDDNNYLYIAEGKIIDPAAIHQAKVISSYLN